MDIGIIGGTGAFGKGLVLRWGRHHRVLIGSRDPQKAEAVAKECRAVLNRRNPVADIVGFSNTEVARRAQVVVLSVKFESLNPIIETCRENLEGKIVVSPVAALEKKGFFQCVNIEQGSVASVIQEDLPASKIVAALHTIPAHRLRNWDKAINGDVPVCGDDPIAKKTVMNLIVEIKNLKIVDAGPLKIAGLIEPLVPLLLNLKLFGGLKSASVQFI